MADELVAGIARVKDELDIIEPVVRHMAAQVDVLLVADNLSSDGTREVLQELSRELPLVVYLDDEVAYLQAEKMTAMAQRAAHEFGPLAWVVPFDADEVWYSGWGTVGEVLRGVEPDTMLALAEVFDHVSTGLDDMDESDPTARICWRRNVALPLPKVACRWRPDLRIHQGNHGADYDGIRPASSTRLVIRHFPYRSPAQFVRKVRNGAAAYRAAGDQLPADMGKHWRDWGQILDGFGETAVENIYHEWFYEKSPLASIKLRNTYTYDPAPVAGRKEAPHG